MPATIASLSDRCGESMLNMKERSMDRPKMGEILRATDSVHTTILVTLGNLVVSLANTMQKEREKQKKPSEGGKAVSNR